MFISLLLTTVLSQTATTTPDCCSNFKFTPSVDANVSVYSFKSADTLVEVNPNITFTDAFAGADISVSLPIWFQDNTGSNQSGLSDLNVNITKDFWSGTAIGGKTTWSGDFGILIPLDASFSSTSLVLVVGTDVSLVWDKLSFSQSVDWTILANGTSWNPLLNSQVDAQWVNGETRLDCKVMDSLTVGAVMSEQWVTTGETSLIVGPEVVWSPAQNWTVSAGVGFPVYQDTKSYDSVNSVVQVGVGFSF